MNSTANVFHQKVRDLFTYADDASLIDGLRRAHECNANLGVNTVYSWPHAWAFEAVELRFPDAAREADQAISDYADAVFARTGVRPTITEVPDYVEVLLAKLVQ